MMIKQATKTHNKKQESRIQPPPPNCANGKVLIFEIIRNHEKIHDVKSDIAPYVNKKI